MSTFFNKLPLEIRSLIYEELLLDIENPIDTPCCQQLDGRKICLTILRTCRQAYAEASSIFYERNLFRVGRNSSRHLHFVNYDLRNQIFLRIKHLDLAYDDDIQFQVLGLGYNPASWLTTVLDSLARFECTLRTLRLDFQFSREFNKQIDLYRLSSPSLNSRVTAQAFKDFVRQEDFRDAVANLKVESIIEIYVTSHRAAYCSIFQDLADAIGFKKQWAVMEHPCAAPLRPSFFAKEWILTPSTTATREKVPTLVGKAHESSSTDRVVDVVDDKS